MLEYASSEIRQPVPVDLTDASLTFTAMADEIVLPIPNLELPQHFFTLSRRYPNTMKMLQNTDVVRLGLFGSSMPMRFTEKRT